MKLFVTSDIHSFYDPFIKALNEAGFDQNNEEHWLIVCGDCFDRGPDSEKLLHFLMPLERKVLVKGNHDILFENLCSRGFPYSHDKSNGTVKTITDLGGSPLPSDFSNSCQIAWDKTAAYRDSLVNYFETEKYIFVHSWIPTMVTYTGKMKPWYQEGKMHSYNKDWRTASDIEWEEAMWGNPFYRWQDGLNQTGKIIVFGHWHCSTGHSLLSTLRSEGNDIECAISEFEDDAIWEPFIHDNIIGIDRCTAHTGECNVIVLEDNFLDK
jgi:serine/threonine protein phosphatase 1